MHMSNSPQAKVELEKAKTAVLQAATAITRELPDEEVFQILWRLCFVDLRSLESHRLVE